MITSSSYNAVLAITGDIKGTFREKSYQELGLEYFQKKAMDETPVITLQRPSN